MTPKPQSNQNPRKPSPRLVAMASLLSHDIWQYIGLKLSVADRIRFRAVCKTWMCLLPSRQPPWLMLAESVNEREQEEASEEEEEEEEAVEVEVGVKEPSVPKPPPHRGFVSLGEQEIHQIDFPEANGARCVGSAGNWLITAHSDNSIRLLNPFSRRQIDLPSQTDFEHNIHNHSIELSQIELWKVVLSFPPSNGDGGDCVAMAIHHFKKILAFARPGDAKWTTVEIVKPPPPYSVNVQVLDRLIHYTIFVEVDDAVFHKGKFYAITTCGELLACDMGDDRNPPKASYLTKRMELYNIFRVNYLVEWLGELLAVLKFVDLLDDGISYRTTKFEIYSFDFSNKKWNEVRSLGEYSLFLGFNTSVALRASEYSGSMKKNCVYFTDDFVFGYIDISRNLQTEQMGGLDMGVFDLDDKSITPHFRGVSTSLYSPPVWVVPT